jgi:hypothetical protein
MTTIPVDYPENISAEYRIFFKRNRYSTKTLHVNDIRNVFVSHEGLCLKNMFLVEKSHFNIKGTSDKTFYFSFWKLVAEQYLVSTFGKSLKKEYLTEGSYLHIYTKWFGYFFWITDSIPKLIKTKQHHSNITLIYPDGWNNISYVKETLFLFPDLKFRVIEKGVHIQVKKLVLPETRQWSNAIDPEEIETTREFLFSKVEENNIQLSYGDKIYISRKKALRRKPVNENEVELIMIDSGFKPVCMEDYSLLEQVSIIKNAKYLVGLHGAGLVNAVFMKSGGAVLELSPQVEKKSDLRIPFWRIANAIKSRFLIQFCKVNEPIPDDIYSGDLIIDINLLKKNLELLLSK